MRFKVTVNAAAAKKDVVLLHLCNIVEVALTNVNMGFN